MTLKEKLDLLWKYLLLAVLVYGFAQMGRARVPAMMDWHDMPGGGPGMMWFGDDDDFEFEDMDIEVEKIGDGDSTIQIIVNGEVMDLKDFEKKGENVFLKKMKAPGKHKEKRIKIIKKEIEDND